MKIRVRNHSVFISAAVLCHLLVIACTHESGDTGQETVSNFILSSSALPEYERNVDHAGLIGSTSHWNEDWQMRDRATGIYRTNCFNCHGNNEQPGSLPNSVKFWEDKFRNGSDPYSMYQTVTRGFGQMPPHPHLVPKQKYEVITFIREELIKAYNPTEYYEVDSSYLAGLPHGDSEGPLPQPYHPWSDMDYGNWLIRCYEMSPSDGSPKVISTRGSPLPNEDYSQVNFAYKGIAARLDPGEGGIADGNTFILFDHDLLRFVGAWTGDGFIDWEGILLDDQHNVYPRNVGKHQFANPITPGWANPATGSFEDPRFLGSDGRPFGPLPRQWAHYKGLYRHDDRIVIKYSVGEAMVLETYDLVEAGERPIISRTLQIENANAPLKLRVAPDTVAVLLKGTGVSLVKEHGYQVVKTNAHQGLSFTVFMSARSQDKLEASSADLSDPKLLDQYTRGSERQYNQVLTSPIIPGNEADPYAVDVFVLPQSNPWKSRLRLTGVDFLDGGTSAVVCTIDGEVWRVDGISKRSGTASWKRIATGMFQPLGIKVHQGAIYVNCRDQIVILRDLNEDGETDFYQSFNSDHQVTEHFHEFAMGLQTDHQGNFYYAKSGRHARTSLVPQHGTLIKVSSDGEQSEILANGFRAANGVCINPDGSFYVTDQQGFWNPMNRINRVTSGGFYGNMWGYGAPADSSDEAMILPVMWVDMKYDRSPSELVWAESDRWGPLNGSLLNLSYGYGKIFAVLTQSTGAGQQAGMIELPVPQFPTGIMRARFNPADGQFYGCGMAAWATSRMIQVGGLYRVRYTGKPLHLPIVMEAVQKGIKLTFSEPLDITTSTIIDNYEINTWDIERSSKYGSDRYNEQQLVISKVEISDDARSLLIYLPDISPTWIMEIKYELTSKDGVEFAGAIQNTIYQLE